MEKGCGGFIHVVMLKSVSIDGGGAEWSLNKYPDVTMAITFVGSATTRKSARRRQKFVVAS